MTPSAIAPSTMCEPLSAASAPNNAVIEKVRTPAAAATLSLVMRRSRSTPISRPAPSATRIAAASSGSAHSLRDCGMAGE
jgi:hypothetical protein